jgi:hypothetical protein
LPGKQACLPLAIGVFFPAGKHCIICILLNEYWQQQFKGNSAKQFCFKGYSAFNFTIFKPVFYNCYLYFFLSVAVNRKQIVGKK